MHDELDTLHWLLLQNISTISATIAALKTRSKPLEDVKVVLG